MLGGRDALLRVVREQQIKKFPGGEAVVQALYASLPVLVEVAEREPVARALVWQVVAPAAVIAEMAGPSRAACVCE